VDGVCVYTGDAYTPLLERETPLRRDITCIAIADIHTWLSGEVGTDGLIVWGLGHCNDLRERTPDGCFATFMMATGGGCP